MKDLPFSQYLIHNKYLKRAESVTHLTPPCVRQAFDYYKQPKDVATYIKKEFDKRYPSDGKATSGVYHCIVGRNFAASVSYETRFFLHFRVGQENVIIFKSKDSPFDTDQVDLNK